MTTTVRRACAAAIVATSLIACSAGTSVPPAAGNASAARRSVARMYLRSADLPDAARYDYLVHAEGIRGASTKAGYKDWIDATGFAVQPASKGVDGALTFTSLTSIASPPLVAFTYSGNPLQRVRLDVLRSENGGERLFMSVELQGPVVASFQSTLIDIGGGVLASGETFVLKAPSVETCVETGVGKSCSTTTSM